MILGLFDFMVRSMVYNTVQSGKIICLKNMGEYFAGEEKNLVRTKVAKN